MTTPIRLVHLACLAIAGVALPVLAQPGVMPPAPLVKPPPSPPPFQPAFQPPPHTDPLAKRDQAGKVIRITGCLDAMALLRNPGIDDAARAAMAPVVADWTAEVNQIAIDNLDFVEQIQDGIIDSYDVNDASRSRIVQQMNVQLSGAGPLSARLQQKNLLSGQAMSLNMQMTNQYIQDVYQEINSAPVPPPAPGAPADPKQMGNAAAVNRFFTALSSRDACEQYRRMLLDSAGLVDKILPAIPAAARDKAAAKVGAVKSASDDVAKMVAVRDLMKALSFDDRRAFMAAAVALGAAPDPYHPAPELPHAVGPAPPSPAPESKPAAN